MTDDLRIQRFAITGVDLNFDMDDGPNLHCSLLEADKIVSFSFEAWDRPEGFNFGELPPTHPTKMMHVQFGDQNWGYQDAVDTILAEDTEVTVAFRCDPPPWVTRTFTMDFSLAPSSIKYVCKALASLCENTGVPFSRKGVLE